MGKKPEVIDAEFTEANVGPRCEITVGIDSDGGVYFRFGGQDQSLVMMDGLLQYANREMNRLWTSAMEKSRAAQEG